jgi:two-component system, NarL family, nitrate/nitrite response regulator NarL
MLGIGRGVLPGPRGGSSFLGEHLPKDRIVALTMNTTIVSLAVGSDGQPQGRARAVFPVGTRSLLRPIETPSQGVLPTSASQSQGMIRVFIVAEIRLFREGLAHVLRNRIDVVGMAATWAEAAPSVLEQSPQIVLLELTTPQSFDAVGQILELDPGHKIVALGVPNSEEELFACAEVGISGYVTRDDSLDTMLEAIERVAQGELLCSPRMAAALFARINALTTVARPADAFRLTAREREIAVLINNGYSNKAIAQQLRIALPTVKNHVHHILEKLQVHRRGEAAARLRAARTGPSPASWISTD